MIYKLIKLCLQLLPFGCTFSLYRYDPTLPHTILTSIPYCVIFPGLYVLNFKPPCHGIVASSSNSSLGFKWTWISVGITHTQATFWIAFLHLVLPGLLYHKNPPVHYILPLTVFISLSLVKVRNQIVIVVMEELWGGHCHCPKFQFHNDQTSEYVSTCNSHKTLLFFITFLYKAIISNGESDKGNNEGI